MYDPWEQLERDLAASRPQPGGDRGRRQCADQYPDDWTAEEQAAFFAAHPLRPGAFPCFPGNCHCPTPMSGASAPDGGNHKGEG